MSTLLDTKEENRPLGYTIRIREEIIDEKHIPMLSTFSCGNEVIDEFLRTKALVSKRETTHIFIDEDQKRIVAFASLSCSALPVMSNHIYNDFIPSVEIAYFALDTRYQKLRMTEDPEDRYLSDSILNLVISHIYDLSDDYCGVLNVTLLATDEGYHLYKRNFFQDLTEEHILQRHNYFIEGCKPMYYRLYA